MKLLDVLRFFLLCSNSREPLNNFSSTCLGLSNCQEHIVMFMYAFVVPYSRIGTHVLYALSHVCDNTCVFMCMVYGYVVSSYVYVRECCITHT